MDVDWINLNSFISRALRIAKEVECPFGRYRATSAIVLGEGVVQGRCDIRASDDYSD